MIKKKARIDYQEDTVKDEKMDLDQSGDDATKVETENEPKSEEYSEVVLDPQRSGCT